MKTTYEPHDYVGPIGVIDGTPFPCSATVRRQRADTGEWEGIPAIRVLCNIDDWMRAHRPGQQVLRTEGAYFFYSEETK